MLKIVVFDSGFGGELFADKLESELPTVNVIRVIDWRNAESFLQSSKKARIAAEKSLRPYIGKVDLIILANYLLSTTSLKYFRKKYKNQKFVGFCLSPRRIVNKRRTLVLTTTATTKNLTFFSFACRNKAKTICLDRWPLLIDDGELTAEDLKQDLNLAMSNFRSFLPQQVMLACGQFSEYIPELRRIFGHNVRIVDSFDHTIHDVCLTLHLRGPKIK